MRGTAIARARPKNLRLIGAFSLRVDGARVHLGRREERLLAFLAMRGPCHRPYVAGSLWPNSDESRALNSLRAALLRVRRAEPNLLDVEGSTLMLRPSVSVDLLDLVDCAERVVQHDNCDTERAEYLLGTGELLPGWYDDWVMFERERLHHLRIRALEVLAVHELDDGHADLALAAAHDAVSLEPLRESARRLLIRAHMALGNRAMAASVLTEYRRDLARDLGVEPSPEMVQEVRVGLSAKDSRAFRARMHRRA
ncbi:AfsR/SARP family transcriptional regulator [Nocardioides sp.]|jgi:DNA-binding SARP family transcriptional activator|uniref:AfsR/SARP family transcriptional regulator n=1 Tax=Nocardioides sp. TaxID=35761 RepID=UPI002F3EE4FF